jgi:hypothetical protein
VLMTTWPRLLGAVLSNLNAPSFGTFLFWDDPAVCRSDQFILAFVTLYMANPGPGNTDLGVKVFSSGLPFASLRPYSFDSLSMKRKFYL